MDLLTRFKCRKEIRKIPLHMRKVHLIQNKEVWVDRVCGSAKDQIERFGPHVAVGIQTVCVAEDMLVARPIRANRDDLVSAMYCRFVVGFQQSKGRSLQVCFE